MSLYFCQIRKFNVSDETTERLRDILLMSWDGHVMTARQWNENVTALRELLDSEQRANPDCGQFELIGGEGEYTNEPHLVINRVGSPVRVGTITTKLVKNLDKSMLI